MLPASKWPPYDFTMRPVFHSQCPRARVRRRLPTSCQVLRLRDYRFVGTRVLDLSSKGMLLETDLPILTGEDLFVSFKAADTERWHECEGTVARVIHGRRRSDRFRALGIAFETIDPFSELMLCEHLRKAPPARMDEPRRRFAPRASSPG